MPHVKTKIHCDHEIVVRTTEDYNTVVRRYRRARRRSDDSFEVAGENHQTTIGASKVVTIDRLYDVSAPV